MFTLFRDVQTDSRCGIALPLRYPPTPGDLDKGTAGRAGVGTAVPSLPDPIGSRNGQAVPLISDSLDVYQIIEADQRAADTLCR